MCNKKRVLTSNEDTLGEVSIQRGIFQGNSLSPLPFIINPMPLSMTLNNNNYGYLLSIEIPINHIVFMDDLRFYDKTERELQSWYIQFRYILAWNLEWKNAVLCV